MSTLDRAVSRALNGTRAVPSPGTTGRAQHRKFTRWSGSRDSGNELTRLRSVCVVSVAGKSAQCFKMISFKDATIRRRSSAEAWKTLTHPHVHIRICCLCCRSLCDHTFLCVHRLRVCPQLLRIALQQRPRHVGGAADYTQASDGPKGCHIPSHS